MRSRHLRPAAAAVSLLLTTLALTACDAGSALPGAGPDDTTAAAGSAGADGGSGAEAGAAVVSTNVRQNASDVPVSKVVTVEVADGTLDSVKVTSPAGAVQGEMADGGAAWSSTGGLEPGVTYTVRSVATGEDGESVRASSRFSTQALTLDQQVYPSVSPLQGEEVGVGMPVIVNFDLPVTDRASFERHMSVQTTPKQAGSWYWLSDNIAHWRPKTYWKPGTQVSVDVDVNGVEAGNGLYGQESRNVDFTVGDANIYKVDMVSHEMKVFSNGELLRTLPITTGEQPKFTTRTGVKVIMEMFDSKTMNSETVGIPNDSADGYNIDNVQWAMRVTNSGEFIHAAPWSVSSQGNANVSHGCTGLSTEDAGWLYSMSKRGDVVEYTGSDRPMEPGNGWTDWNVSWPEYQTGSALS
ncbi:L,D-transpeptidase [Nocardioides nanhaiensis]|uniref:Ig-like domain-containing protein n=1 Tax=Nocardioides nanhaiensis TaxID=1476871 RepID=A0ABP8WSE7_9ACTN